MFRVVYLNNNNDICHKGNFNQISEAIKWVDNQKDITALHLAVYNDYTNSYMKIMDL